MTDEAFVVAVSDAPRLRGRRARMRQALRKPANWLQLLRFATVGASGYVVNLVIFTLSVHGAGLDYILAAVLAFIVALANNFLWNRGWTFRAGEGHAGFQAARFVVVSLVAFGFNVLVLYLLVEHAGLAKVPAQAIAIAAATPLNFVGNKLWSFKL
ncbi:MAG: GtrA family protein [Solirubrobacterales bacterium]|nr:GtrA family protein [Solirubrobacterales bacterium]